jgi:ATP synthase protein I
MRRRDASVVISPPTWVEGGDGGAVPKMASSLLMKPWKEYGRYGSVGIELVLSMAIGYYGGRWVDARLSGHGWITLLGFVAGVVVGFRAIFNVSQHMMKDIERAERADRGEDPWDDKRDDKGHDDGADKGADRRPGNSRDPKEHP